MTSKEKQVSCLNNYFVYVSAEKLEKNNLTKNIDEIEIKSIKEPQGRTTKEGRY